MIRSEFMTALNQLASERGIEAAVILETLKRAMLAAYRKDKEEGSSKGVEVEIDPETGEVQILEGEKNVTPPGFGRIAAQTAKQVILQGVREAEKAAVIEEFTKKLGTNLSGMLQRKEGDAWIVDIGRTTAVLPPEEQIVSERYRQNQRLKFYLKMIRERGGKSEIIVSRTDPELVRGLFEIEVPEVSAGSVEIKAIAREAGSRSKVAVASTQERVDPIGSCVGQRGVRVQTITSELSGEKMDIILWSEDPSLFISAALSPAKVTAIKVKEKKKETKVEVPNDQLSLAIGKGGQNVRLAAKLTGYRIDIRGKKEKDGVGEQARVSPGEVSELEQLGLKKRIVNALAKAGITTVQELKEKSAEDLLKIKGIGQKALEEIKKKL